MSLSQLPITSDEIAALPQEFRALLQAVIDHYEQRIASLEAELSAVKKTPRNSSLPPSSEHPHAKPSPAKPPSPRKPGGQAGHQKHERVLIPTEQCQHVESLKPETCRRCGESLTGSDPEPLRHQVWEIPEIKPVVTEYQLHRLICPGCRESSCAPLPTGVPQGQAGPQLIAFVALLMGCFRQSKRKTALFLTDILQIPCSPAWMVKLQKQATAALRPAYDELVKQLPEQGRLNIDETPHKQGSQKTWLWAFIAARFTVFALRLSRKAEELYAHVGAEFSGVVGCDRAKMYFGLRNIQWCWAHLIRDFQALIDSDDGKAKRLGHDLLRPVRTMFTLWHRVRDGTLTRRGFQRLMQPIRQEVEALLLRGVFSGNPLFAGMCEELHRGRTNLWTFVDVPGVAPTNNDAERALRHAVIWRKLSFGTHSDAGSRFVETMLTVIETCRQNDRNAFNFIRHAVTAHFADQPHPVLLTGV